VHMENTNDFTEHKHVFNGTCTNVLVTFRKHTLEGESTKLLLALEGRHL
jgi:hypothetical protein